MASARSRRLPEAAPLAHRAQPTASSAEGNALEAPPDASASLLDAGGPRNESRRMRIVVVGASGTIGRAVCTELGARHQVLRAGRSGPDLEADMTSEASIAAMYERAGAI